MGDFFLLAAVVAMICMTGFGVVAYTMGRASGLSLPDQDSYVAQRLSSSRHGDHDGLALEFPRALFGYERSAVDAVVNRLGIELAAAALRIAQSSSTANEAWDVRGSATGASGDTEELPR